jgi:hypothetical protein
MEIITRKKQRKVIKRKKSSPVEFISTGNTMIDLILSGKGRGGGFARGRISNIVGDGSTGKTLLALELCAWVFYNIKRVKSKIFPKVKRVIVIFNNVEAVMDMPLESMFGKQFVKNIEWVRISTAEGFGRFITRRCAAAKRGDFILIITDSWDAVKAEDEASQFESDAKKNEQSSDGFGVSKQKYTWKFFRNITDKIYGEDYIKRVEEGDYLDQKDVTMIFTSQIRHKMGTKNPFEKDVYRTGGGAFNFYTHQCIWLYDGGKIKKDFQKDGKKRRVVSGIKVRAVVERNKVAKPWREVRFPIVFDYGL